MREFINKYGIVVACSVIVIAGVLFYLLWPKNPTATSKYAFYVDDVTGQESKQLATEVPPINDANGAPNLVEEVKLKCSGKVKVAYFIKYTPEAHDRLVQLNSDEANLPGVDERARRDAWTHIEDEKQRVIRAGKQIKAPGGQWVDAGSEEGQKIVNDAMCADDVSVEVRPD